MCYDYKLSAEFRGISKLISNSDAFQQIHVWILAEMYFRRSHYQVSDASRNLNLMQH